MNKSTDYIASLAKGLRVLECFGAEAPKLPIAEVAQVTGLDRASARRCLLTLHHEGYLDYDGKFFSPTTQVLRLGTGALAALPMPRIVQPWLDQLSDRIGESVSVAILDRNEIVYIARASQQRIMSIGLMPGSRLPAHCTSMGRVMLAALPEPEACRILDETDLSPRTFHSKTDVNDIIEQLRNTSRDGYALVDQEVEIGVRSLAVPIIDSRNRVVAALNIGLAALGSDPQLIVERYLAEMLRVQSSLQALL